METQQELKNNICLIGYGYWGKILHKNLLQLGYDNITIVDEVLDNLQLLNEDYEYYFLVTPMKTHYELLKKLGSYQNKKIWCEKPLVGNFEQAKEIYSLMEKNNNLLFVDWIYTFNPCIDFLKNICSTKKIKQVILNRTNDGPARYDCGSIKDLSSHDLSILYHIFGDKNYNFTWNEFSIKTNEDFGSSIGWYYEKGMQIIINSSWQHKNKNRVSIFVTNDDEIITFDDIKKTVVTSLGVNDFSNYCSPLHLAIEHFFSSEQFEQNKKITLKITKNLEDAI